MQRVQVEKGVSYEITADGDKRVIEWPFEDDNCLHALSGWGTCRHYFDAVEVRLYSRGENQMAEIRSLIKRGYLRRENIRDLWNLQTIDRVRKYSKRDDFPTPAHVVGTTKLWDPADLEEWRRANAPVSKHPAGPNTGAPSNDGHAPRWRG